MHNAESVLKNETHKLLWDFEIETDHLILDRQTDLIIINKKERSCSFGEPESKIERKRKKKKKPLPCKGIEKNCGTWK